MISTVSYQFFQLYSQDVETHNVKVKVKANFALEQATKAQSGNRCIALLFF